MVTGPGSFGQALATHSLVDKVGFTGKGENGNGVTFTHMYMHVFIHTITFEHTPCMCMHMITNTLPHTYIHYALACIPHMHMYENMPNHMPTYMHSHMPTYMHSYMPTYMHSYMPTYRAINNIFNLF